MRWNKALLGLVAILIAMGPAWAWAQQVPKQDSPEASAPGKPATEATLAEAVLSEKPTGPRTILWVLEVGEVQDNQGKKLAAQAPAIFTRILAGSADKHTVVGKPAQLVPFLRQNANDLPGCLAGIQPCKTPIAAAMQSLGADLLVRGTLSRTGPRWTLKVQLLGPDGRVSLERSIQGGGVPGADNTVTAEKGLEEVAFNAVRELFKASGKLEIITTPPGAQVRLDQKILGNSPLTTEVSVGIHELELLLDDHAPLTRSVRVRAGKETEVKVGLSPTIGTLIVDSTPVMGQVFIDAQHKGSAGNSIALPPGTYELEIRADGYKPRILQVKLEAEESKVMSLTLEPKRQSLQVAGLGEVETDAIESRHYYGRASYRFTGVGSTLDDAEGTLGNRTLALDGLTTDGERVEGLEVDLGYHGLHLEVGYFWDNWGVAALGLSIFGSSDTADAVLRDGNTLLRAELDEFSRVEITPAQLLFRYPYENLHPMIQTGFGYANTEFQATFDDATGNRTTFSRDGFFWNFSIEANYFFDSWWYAHASLGVRRDLTRNDTQTFFGFGLGMTFDDPLTELGFREDSAPPRSVQDDPQEPTPLPEDNNGREDNFEEDQP